MLASTTTINNHCSSNNNNNNDCYSRPIYCQTSSSSQETGLKIRKARLSDTELEGRLHTNNIYHHLNLMNLIELDLSYNLLTKLPTALSQLSNLKHINLSSNRFSVFPFNVVRFTKLETLNLSRNLLKEGFPYIYCEQLINLKRLRLCENLIPSLPTNFNKLINLEHLILGSSTGGNLITSFPPNTLPSLSKLKSLDLSHNRFVSLPVDIGFRGSQLEYLCVHNNQLVSLPRSIGLCQSLRSLDLSRNSISFLPLELVDLEGLQSLDLSSNSLCVIPSDIAAYMRRTSLLLTGNPMISQRDQLSSIGDFSTVTPYSHFQSGTSSPLFSSPTFSSQQLTQRLTDLQLSSGETREEMVPSLRELAARVVLAQGIPVDPNLIPRSVMRSLDLGARPCDLCKQPYVSEFLERVEMRGCQGHPNLPTSVAYCSTRCHTLSSTSTTPTLSTPHSSTRSPLLSTTTTTSFPFPFPAPLKLRTPFPVTLTSPYEPLYPLVTTPRSWKPQCIPTLRPIPSPTPVIPVADLTMVDSLNDW